MTSRAARWVLPAALVAALCGGAAAKIVGHPGKGVPSGPDNAATAAAGLRWLRVEYGALIDRRELTHSGEPVGVVLDRLGGRGLPAEGERHGDATAYALLDPLLEPYAFVLPDALDSLEPPSDPPLVEIGGLWEAGEEQPAWAELCRARKLILESDGTGHLRALLPARALEALPYDDAAPAVDPASAAHQAWDEAWPVLRHALGAERRRLERERRGAAPPLEVEVHAYRHLLSRGAFVLGAIPWRTTITDTGPSGLAAPLDLEALRSILEQGRAIEGARLEPSGRIRWMTGRPDSPPSILGRAPTLADLAVAYRAVAWGGSGEPYMSLDRATAPHVAEVNYGGRLRDTALGMVSLLSDVRFKTMSVGIDLLGAGDIRASIRDSMPDFRTHLERFASDPAASGVVDQQTRFWFYPDDVDVVLSPQFDLFAFRKARMTAASERVTGGATGQPDPPWTRDTVAFVNNRHDAWAALFPEIGELDTAARYLAVFTWLSAARSKGLAIPDADVLLALTLPSVPTPRRFPELLSFNALPAAGGQGVVDVFDRTAVGRALDRLEPRDGRPLSPARGFARAKASLDRRIPDEAAAAAAMDAAGAQADDVTLDLLSYRAERLRMHERVLATLDAQDRGKIAARREHEPSLRVFSVGIGGIDLGMKAALARATSAGVRLAMTAVPPAGGAGAVAAARPQPAPAASAAANTNRTPAEDAALLPKTMLPDHGLGTEAQRTTTVLPEGRGILVARDLPGAEVARGVVTTVEGGKIAWQEVRLDDEGPEARVRFRLGDPAGRPPSFVRVEDGRYIAYRFERDAGTLRAVPGPVSLPDPVRAIVAPEPPDPASGPAQVPDGLALLSISGGAAGAPGSAAEASSLRLRVRAGGRDVSADVRRGVLERLVVGREADLLPGRPLPAFTPAKQMLGSDGTLMVMAGASEGRPPWGGPVAERPGEEDAARVARALDVWWRQDAGSGAERAVVGTDAAESPARWAAAAVQDGRVDIVAPADAFPAGAEALRARLTGAVERPGLARLVVLVSAEPPGLLGRRLRALARDPAMSGRALAVLNLGGALRGDLPWSLLHEGNLSALGVHEAGPIGLAAAVDEVLAWVRSAEMPGAQGRRPESIPGPMTWYY
jgi:hypothetical protein